MDGQLIKHGTMVMSAYKYTEFRLKHDVLQDNEDEKHPSHPNGIIYLAFRIKTLLSAKESFPREDLTLVDG